MTVLSLRGLELLRGSNDSTYRVSLPSLELHAGEVLAITGPSGCGKSTLIEAIGLILKPVALANYALLGEDITSWVQAHNRADDARLASLRSQYFGFVPQSGGLLPYLTVAQNVRLQAQILGKTPDADWIGEMSARLGLEGLAQRYPQALSMGQRQRVSFLRAIAHRPAILLADEPTAALDPEHAARLFRLMLDVVRQVKVAAVVVTHEWSLVRELDLKSISAQGVRPGHMEFVG